MARPGDRQECGRCERCDRPLTPLEWQDGWMPVYTADGQCEGDILCPGPSVDWRARALAAEATHADVMAVLHQHQPGGSPPAGDVLLAQWTLETLTRERDSARALAASNAETMRACAREAAELDRQLGAARAREAALATRLEWYRCAHLLRTREAALREALVDAVAILRSRGLAGDQKCMKAAERGDAALAKEST